MFGLKHQGVFLKLQGLFLKPLEVFVWSSGMTTVSHARRLTLFMHVTTAVSPGTGRTCESGGHGGF